MGLQADGLIELGEDGRYRLPSKSILDAFTATELNSLLKTRRLRPRVLELIEARSGAITRQGIHKELSKDKEMSADYYEIDNLVYELSGGPIVIVNADETLAFAWNHAPQARTTGERPTRSKETRSVTSDSPPTSN